MAVKKYFTTPIYYVNDIPHIGHAYNILATDTLARYWRNKIGRENVFFLTGTDENSQKTVDAAHKAGEEIYEYLEKMAANWRTTWEKIGIDFDDFIRTTEERHVKNVHRFVTRLHQNGDIYKGEYKGLYCTGCEAFKKEGDLENGLCPDHNRAPEQLAEENYFFRLSQYEDQLLELLENDLLIPEKRKNEWVSFVKSGLEDISISRESAEIGIELPWDPDHKIYVWIDALINYRSAIKNTDKEETFWPEVHHIIGKDIAKFHAVIWPAMLLAAGIQPPKQIFAHGFFTVDGTKMSKTLGNVVDPLDLSKQFGNDALRVGLLSSFEFGNDGDFSASNFAQFYNTKLGGGVGNLFNRVIVLLHKFCDGKRLEPIRCGEGKELKDQFEKHLENYELKGAIDFFFQTVDAANQRLNDTEVWKLAKTDPEAAQKVFQELFGYLEFLAEMSETLLPESAPKMKAMLGEGEHIGEAQILFERV